MNNDRFKELTEKYSEKNENDLYDYSDLRECLYAIAELNKVNCHLEERLSEIGKAQ